MLYLHVMRVSAEVYMHRKSLCITYVIYKLRCVECVVFLYGLLYATSLGITIFKYIKCMLHTKIIWFSLYVSPIREEPFEKFLTACIATTVVLYALLGGNGQSPPKQQTVYTSF